MPGNSALRRSAVVAYSRHAAPTARKTDRIIVSVVRSENTNEHTAEPIRAKLPSTISKTASVERSKAK